MLYFLLMPAIGTLLHECGHALAGELAGFDTELHYGSTSFYGDGNYFLAILGGPLSNMAIGTLGMLWYWRRRRGRTQSAMDGFDWTAFMAALFWARQIHALLGILLWVAAGRVPSNMDEWKLAVHLDLHPSAVTLFTGCIGLWVCHRAVFVYSPRPMRRGFLLLGVPACGLGMLVWYQVIGPALLP